MYYEYGYERISSEELREYERKGYEQRKLPLRFLDIKDGCLTIIGESSSISQALLFISSQLEISGGSGREFSAHFMCEDRFGVRIVNLQNNAFSRQLCAC